MFMGAYITELVLCTCTRRMWMERKISAVRLLASAIHVGALDIGGNEI